jgi:hypothetical protein
MNTDTFYQIHESRPNLRVNLPKVATELHRDFPMHTRAEIIDALTTAQYDIETARIICQEAASQGVALATYLAQHEEVQGDR